MENANVSQIFRPTAELTQQDAIREFLSGLLLPGDAQDIERIEVVDITNNGFGPDDMVVVHPSMEMYIIDQPDPGISEIMRSWNFEEQQRDASNELSADYFYPEGADTLDLNFVSEEEMMDLVQNSILSDLLESLNRNYNALPISLRLERDQEGFTFQMWDYQREAFSFSPRPPATPDSIGVYDMMYVLYSDSTIVADTTYYDLMYINRTVENTIYLPEEDEVVTDRFDTVRLPGIPRSRARLD
ncbi:Sec7 domain-containing protein [Rhodohalobacter sp. 8-1]|uniref:Sec7 domain-containing protein n=1 Tax=Rhodohalobacter sp. 8-1 TaxID=3131972 RepID=UPI0030ECB462